MYIEYGYSCVHSRQHTTHVCVILDFFDLFKDILNENHIISMLCNTIIFLCFHVEKHTREIIVTHVHNKMDITTQLFLCGNETMYEYVRSNGALSQNTPLLLQPLQRCNKQRELLLQCYILHSEEAVVRRPSSIKMLTATDTYACV